MKTTIPANSENVINITIDKGCIIRYSLCFFKCIHFYIYGPPVQSSNPGWDSFWLARTSGFSGRGGASRASLLPSGAGGGIHFTFSYIVDI